MPILWNNNFPHPLPVDLTILYFEILPYVKQGKEVGHYRGYFHANLQMGPS